MLLVLTKTAHNTIKYLLTYLYIELDFSTQARYFEEIGIASDNESMLFLLGRYKICQLSDLEQYRNLIMLIELIIEVKECCEGGSYTIPISELRVARLAHRLISSLTMQLSKSLIYSSLYFILNHSLEVSTYYFSYQI